MKKSLFSVVSLLLAFLMCMYMLPTSVFADVASLLPKTDEIPQLSNGEADSTEKAVEESVFEVTELREENAKHFKLKNGQYYLATYPKAVHYLDENGNWQDIDNTLSEGGGEISTSNSKIKFSKKITGNQSLLTIHNGNMKVEIGLDGAVKGTVGEIVENELKNKEYDESTLEGKLSKLTELENLKGEVIYKDILEDVDVQYILESNGIKENIIVKEKGGEYVYTYNLKLNNMTAVLADNGDVLLCDNNGNTVYTMPAPVVYDSEYNYAPNGLAWYTLEGSNKKYTLRVHVNSDWMENASYPVVVDPAIDNNSAAPGIEDGIADDLGFSSDDERIVVFSNSYGIINIASVPELPVGSSVTEGILNYYVCDSYSMTGKKMSLFEYSGVGFENIQDYESGTLGRMYSYFSFDSNYEDYVRFDVTQIYRDLYQKENAPSQFAIKINDPGSSYVILWSQESNEVTKPILSIKYINTVGIVDCYTNDTISMGYAGTGYISHNSSQLTIVRNDISSTNASFSFSVGYVYNSMLCNEVFDPKNINDESIYSTNVGLGGKLTTQQFVMKVPGEEIYQYIDADGTCNYMYLSDYDRDEAGTYMVNREYTSSFLTGAKLVTDLTDSKISSDYPYITTRGYNKSNSIILEYDSGDTMLFYNGVLALCADESGNIAELEYATHLSATTYGKPSSSSNILFGIKQYNKTGSGYTSAVESFVFEYNTAGRLTGITCGHDRVEYSYSVFSMLKEYYPSTVLYKVSDDLSTWTISASAYYTMAWNKPNAYINYVYDGITGLGADFEYDAVSGCYTAYSEANLMVLPFQYGSKYSISRQDNTTEVKYLGIDGISSSDDIITVYNIDNYGRTVNVYTKDKDGNIHGVSNGEYVSDDTDNANLIKSSSVLGKPSVNLMQDPSIENTASTLPLSGSVWNANVTASSSSFSVKNSRSRSGDSSVMINIPDGQMNDWYVYQNVTIRETGQYCLSAYFYLDGVTGIGTGGGAYVKAANVIDANGIRATSSLLVDKLELSTNQSVNDSWQRASVSFYGEAGKTYKLIIGSKYVWGAMYIDDIQLEKSGTPGKFSSAGWDDQTGDYTLDASVSMSYLTLGSANEISGSGEYSDSFIIYPKDTASYTVSAWAKADSVKNPDAKFGITYTIDYVDVDTGEVDSDGNPVYQNIDITGYIPFNSDIEQWQFVSGNIASMYDVEIIRIIIKFDYSENFGIAKFAGLSVVENSVSKYSYNSKGKVTASQTGSNSEDSYEYDDYDRLVRYVNEDAVEVTVDYGSDTTNKKPLSTTANGLTTSYGYDSAGNTTSVTTTVENGNSVLSMLTNSSYNTNMKRMISSTDENRINAVYSYDSKGSVTAQTVGNITTNYAYNSLYQMTKVWIGDQAQVEYSYLNGVLSKITAGVTGQTLEYTFSYDNLDRVTLIKVADQILAQYQYLSGTGLVSEITYGQNLFTISYTYDIFGRVEEIYHGATLAYSYSYNTNGGVDTLTDHKNSRKYLYEYDMYDRATSCKVYSIATGAYLEGSRLGYDKHGRTKWESSYHSAIPATVTNVYTYDDNSNLTNISTSRGDIETGYVYDGFYRLSSESLYRYIGMGGSYSSPTLTRSYSYVLKNGYTTNLIEKLSYSGLSSREFTYSYDSYGNISSAGYNGNTSTYEYDDLGQLTRENNQEAGKTWVYEYDSRGNILSRKTYAYTTGDLGTIQDTDVYTYSGDRLMSYDGSMEFQYDAIGNPTLYFNSRSSGDIYTFTWEEGRQLASGDRSGTSFSYTYDMNGIRTSKTVGDSTYNYFTSGGKLQAMTIVEGTTVTAIMYFYYNASGIPVALKYNNVVYYYLTNLQGDVVGIVNANGGIVVTYSYDAWGRPLSSTCAGNYDQPLMENNPLRYRGYIYDNETGFYYLQSRYYDPDVGRFINGDGQLNGGLLGNNLYAYCENNPVNYYDSCGENMESVISFSWIISGIEPTVIGEIISAVVTMVCLGFAIIGTSSSIDVPVSVESETNIETVPMQYNDTCIETIPIQQLLACNTIYYPNNTGNTNLMIYPIITLSKSNIMFRGGKQNVKHDEFKHLSDEEVIKLYKTPTTPKDLKQKLNRELKGRHKRNVNKRKELY